jgi:hypothetical protein
MAEQAHNLGKHAREDKSSTKKEEEEKAEEPQQKKHKTQISSQIAGVHDVTRDVHLKLKCKAFTVQREMPTWSLWATMRLPVNANNRSINVVFGYTPDEKTIMLYVAEKDDKGRPLIDAFAFDWFGLKPVQVVQNRLTRSPVQKWTCGNCGRALGHDACLQVDPSFFETKTVKFEFTFYTDTMLIGDMFPVAPI